MHKALDLARNKGIAARVVDLRTLLPWDQETVAEQVRATGKVLVLTEDTLTGSIAADIAAWIGRHCFQWLDAPVHTLGSLDTPVPLAKPLEDQFLPWERLEGLVKELMDY